MNSTSSNAALLTVSKIVTLIINMIVTMLLSRYRTLTEYGTFSQINIVSSLATSLFAMGLPTCINYFLNKTDNQQEKKLFLSSYFTVGTILGVLIAVILAVCYPLIVKYFDNEFLYTYRFVMLTLPWISIFNSSVENIFIAYQKINQLILYRLSYSIFMVVIAYGVALMNCDFYTYMVLYMVVQVIYVIYIYLYANHLAGGFRLGFDAAGIKSILTYSIPLGISAVISTLNIQIDNVMVGGKFGTDLLAIYSNVSKELPLNMLSISVATVILPKIVYEINNGNEKKAIDCWNVSILLSGIIICFASAALFVFAKPVIMILYSDKYLPGINVFRVYAITSLVKITSWGIVMTSTKNNKMLLNISCITLLINIIMNLILMNWIGIVGAALATMISEFAGVLIKLYYSAKIVKMPLKSLMPWKKLLQLLAINAILGAVFIVLNHVLSMSHLATNIYIRTFVSGGIWFGIYCIMLRKKFITLWKELNCF